MSELDKFDDVWEPLEVDDSWSPVRAADLRDRYMTISPSRSPFEDNALAVGCGVIAIIVAALTVLALVVTL